MILSRGVHVAAFFSSAIALGLNPKSQSSVRNVAAAIAYETMTYYRGNTTDPKSREFGSVKQPYYWWVAGGLWGAMMDYYHYTTDPSYNGVLIQALLAPTNLGPGENYQPLEHSDEEGNDDLFFWGSAVLSAAERNFPQPNPDRPSWLTISANVFNELVGRWDTAHCGGGLFWQILPNNPNGMTYKNSISNGGFFQLSARLARATGNKTYDEWAEKIWDWNAAVGLIDNKTYHIYDGTNINTDCKETNKQSFSYTTGIFLYGAAIMANATGDDRWAQRTKKLLDEAAVSFFTGDKKNIMYEPACEPANNCNYDMITFKGFLSRFMWQTAQILPSLREKVDSLMIPTAQAVASTCTGGKSGRQCGIKWYTGKFDYPYFGSQMGALEAVQGLLAQDSAVPLKGNDIKWVKDAKFKPIDTNADTGSTRPASSSKHDAGASPTTAPPTSRPSSTAKSDENGAAVVSAANDKFALLCLAILIPWLLT
ncbi:hypothetical protein QQS21_006942 [Conoideocrella luteorostrata]|uniref:Mannan endo-1,6-alpha-mannosidase n=1 Tax=Conoideocrella luteorostrata TaxID=1105319 RepID=A0AAJ0CPL9_9HYPO|nr:hypothetical protein QQS21_006942 [Conoideocrella luteorostrata]